VDVAQTLGFSVRSFRNKKTGTIDEKKLVLKTGFEGANARLSALRAFTKVKPLSIKKGEHSAFIFFNKSQLDRMVSFPTSI
jgi:hypothetical protein